MYFYRNIIENKDGKKSEGSYLSCVRNGEFYFSLDWSFNGPYIIRDSNLWNSSQESVEEMFKIQV